MKSACRNNFLDTRAVSRLTCWTSELGTHEITDASLLVLGIRVYTGTEVFYHM